ncbi:restriction endonuclease subunit S [Corynebacterium gerontici]|uniref:EcoKI restriction-modification system protein HsdS n=1 Tax=Corynebacterium gerontici TaxID=2079234 RepID=A0A3G6J320_9CORY|nr:restriction endonuclease subunit S [Corynebacterium gerontici]AZA10800.1 EcoKI restriction-modification system protein HsdS [Corynebacterium gerontici]
MKLKDIGITPPLNWQEKLVAEVTVKVGSGATPRGGKSVYVEKGVPFVRSQNVHDHSFKEDNLAFIDEDASTQLRSVELLEKDILLNITGDSILRCCLLPDKFIGGRVNQHVSIVRPSEAVLPIFLQKWLTSPVMKSMMLAQASGGTRKAITKRQILQLPVALPPIAEQRRIAGLLGALDDKIESVSKISVILQDLGDTVFGSFACREIKLSEVAEITMGASPPGTSYNDDGDGMTFYQGIRDFGFRYPQKRVYTTSPKKKAISGDALLSVRAPVGTLNSAFEDCCIGRGLAAVRSKYPSLIYYSLRASQPIWDSFQSEGTIFGSINRSHLSSIQVPWVEETALDSLEYRLGLIDNNIKNLQAEKRTLEGLRDTLLPELMSGRMRVEEAKGLVMEVLDGGGPE